MLEALGEIANRASNLADDDAAEWMPSIYRIACEAIGEDPSPLLKATGFDGEPKDWPSRGTAATPVAGRADAIQECIDIAQRYDDCGANFIIEKMRELTLAAPSLPTQPAREEECAHAPIIGLDGKWHCQRCGAGMELAVAQTSTDHTQPAREEVREALKNLADLYFMIDDCDADPDDSDFFRHDGCHITYGDIRKARAIRAALAQSPRHRRADGERRRNAVP